MSGVFIKVECVCVEVSRLLGFYLKKVKDWKAQCESDPVLRGRKTLGTGTAVHVQQGVLPR